MSGMNELLKRNCKDDAVYWGTPANDGEGGYTFADPVDIKCRWETMNQIVTDARGNEMTSRALVYVMQDLDEEGYLYKGTLDDLSGEDTTNPASITDAFIIKRFQKLPALGSTSDYVRRAYLTPSLSFGGF